LNVSVSVEQLDGVAVITIDHPPVNALSAPTRRAIAEAVWDAERSEDVLAVVLIGGRAMFSAGADISEFGTPRATQEPNLRSLIREIERCETPVIAALDGTVMGGGLELALGCHYRVATARAMLALPEVKLGLIPGAGGTQRLPRAIGVEAALEMIVDGSPRTAAVLAALPDQRLIDRLVDAPSSLIAESAHFARTVALRRSVPHLRDRAPVLADGEALATRARVALTGPPVARGAAHACIRCVTATTTMTVDDGLDLERRSFLSLMSTPESRALRHAFFAERAASRIDGISSDTPTRTIASVGVVGAGTMGTGIAMSVLAAGLPVTLVDTSDEAVQRGIATITCVLEEQQRKGKLGADDVTGRLGQLRGTASLRELATSDLIIEAVFEELSLKQAVFRTLDDVARHGAILATNTSTLDVDAIARVTSRPGDVVGLHFFSPAQVMKLLEVVRGAATSPSVLATAMAFAKTLRKVSVVARNGDGFIGNRMWHQYARQAAFLLDAGCEPQQVDRAMEQFGMAMGPFRVSDLAGNDIGWAVRKRRALEQPDIVDSRAPDRLCEAGRFGQKVGAGWYDYPANGREHTESAAVRDMLRVHRQHEGLTPRVVSDTEIVERLMLALINEGAQLLDDGIASRASDIDVVYLMGYGFPRWRGGPMHYADQLGLWSVVRTLERLARTDPASWTPAPRLVRLAEASEPLSSS
jgi:3-hydroxyacyl-CoA dehydrogenase